MAGHAEAPIQPVSTMPPLTRGAGPKGGRAWRPSEVLQMFHSRPVHQLLMSCCSFRHPPHCIRTSMHPYHSCSRFHQTDPCIRIPPHPCQSPQLFPKIPTVTQLLIQSPNCPCPAVQKICLRKFLQENSSWTFVQVPTNP